jgi:DDE superfamily endonuclease
MIRRFRHLKKDFPSRVAEIVSQLAAGTPIELWFQDEMRVGQKNGLTYQWAKKGTRPRQPKDQRYENAYLFGAVCPSRDTGVAIIMPYADTEAMQKHVDEISRAVAPGAHGLILFDQAGWHTTQQDPKKSYDDAAAAGMSRTQCSGKHLAISPPKLSGRVGRWRVAGFE